MSVDILFIFSLTEENRRNALWSKIWDLSFPFKMKIIFRLNFKNCPALSVLVYLTSPLSGERK